MQTGSINNTGSNSPSRARLWKKKKIFRIKNNKYSYKKKKKMLLETKFDTHLG